jgi:DNA (cytosine-5)-methyltransferase 1
LEQDQTTSEDNQIRQRDDSTSLNRMETRRDEDVANTEQSRSSSESIGDFGSMEEKVSREEEERNQSSIRTSTRSTDVADSDRMQRLLLRGQKSESGQETFERSRIGSSTPRENVANTHSGRSDEPNNEIQAGRNITGSSSEDVADTESSIGDDIQAVGGIGEFKTQEVFGDGSSIPGESAWWDVEPNVGRVAHGIPGRVYRLKGLGNAIVPQIAQEIGNAIITAEIEEKKKGCPHN